MVIPALFIIITIIISALVGIRIIASKYSQLSSQNRLLKALRSLDKLVISSPEIESLYQGIVEVIHKELGFTFAILALVDKEAQIIKRIAISLDSDSTQTLHDMLPVKFKEQIVPLSNTENLFTKVVLDKTPLHTRNLYDIQKGVLPSEISAKIQRLWRLKSIFLYPILIRGEVVGILEYSSTKEKEKLSALEILIMEEFTAEVSRALDNAFLYQNLKDTSRQLVTANTRLQQLDQLKDDFVSVTSHELRTPMTAIRSYIWMALNRPDIPLTEKLKKYLQRTLISTERLINLVSDMLNISRIEAGRIEINPQEYDMVILVNEVMEEVKPRAQERNITIEILSTPIPKIFADRNKVHQVLLNLLGNSLKFTPSGGKISISFFGDGQIIETSVKDSGSGIAKEDLGQLFTKFGRLDNSYVAMGTSGGTGLGLYICKSLVNLMHGRIWAFSDGLGKGATFTFSLPVASADVLDQSEKYHIKPKEEVRGLEPVAL